MLIPAEQSPVLSVAYGARQQHAVEFAHTDDVTLIRRYPSHYAGWERVTVDPTNAAVIAGINDLLLAYAASAA